MKIVCEIKKLYYLCINVTNDVAALLVKFLNLVFGFIPITIRKDLRQAANCRGSFPICRQSGCSTELSPLGIYLPKNNSVKFFDSLYEMCLLCRPLTSIRLHGLPNIQHPFSRKGKLSNQTSLAFLNKILRKRKAMNPQMQD